MTLYGGVRPGCAPRGTLAACCVWFALWLGAGGGWVGLWLGPHLCGPPASLCAGRVGGGWVPSLRWLAHLCVCPFFSATRCRCGNLASSGLPRGLSLALGLRLQGHSRGCVGGGVGPVFWAAPGCALGARRLHLCGRRWYQSMHLAGRDGGIGHQERVGPCLAFLWQRPMSDALAAGSAPQPKIHVFFGWLRRSACHVPTR